MINLALILPISNYLHSKIQLPCTSESYSFMNSGESLFKVFSMK